MSTSKIIILSSLIQYGTVVIMSCSHMLTCASHFYFESAGSLLNLPINKNLNHPNDQHSESTDILLTRISQRVQVTTASYIEFAESGLTHQSIRLSTIQCNSLECARAMVRSLSPLICLTIFLSPYSTYLPLIRYNMVLFTPP